MAIKPDQIATSTVLPNYIITGNPNSRSSIDIFGTVANLSVTNFTQFQPFTLASSTSRYDIYADNFTLAGGSSDNQLITTSNYFALYQKVSTEFVQMAINQTGLSVSVTITVNNFTGGSITLTLQTVDLLLIQYEMGF